MDKIREEFEKVRKAEPTKEAISFGSIFFGLLVLVAEWFYMGYKSRDEEIKRAYDYLSACGVPKERAGSLHNGIDVLATRFRKEINLDAGEKAVLKSENKKLKEQLSRLESHMGLPSINLKETNK